MTTADLQVDTHRMPPGYGLMRVDDHFIWVLLTEDGQDWTRESCICWNPAWVRRWAWDHYMERQLKVANEVLATFSPSKISKEPTGWYVEWEVHGVRTKKRWQIQRGNDFFAVWHRKWPGGGTAMTALSQLIRWLRGQPVLPIGTWAYWASDLMRLLPPEAVGDLSEGGYPDHADCVLCGTRLGGSLDWWSLDGVSGPCCRWANGCRQRIDSSK